MAGGRHKVKCANEKKREKRGIRDHHPNNAIFIFNFLIILIILIKKQPF